MWSVTIIFALLLLVIIGMIIYLLPFFTNQFSAFNAPPSKKLEEVQEKTFDLIKYFNITNLTTQEIKDYLQNWLKAAFAWLSKDILDILARVTRVATFLIFTPFLLFYLLRDSQIFYGDILDTVPKTYRKQVEALFVDLDETLSYYISGQFLIALIIGTLIFIGYLSIGLDYPFFLATFALVFNLIPFVGTFISTIPALIVGFLISPVMAIKVLLVIIIVHSLDANVISPNILGRRLNIHPVTIILLLLACGYLYGVLGLLLATPIYAVVKVLLKHLYEEQTLV
jgi:predicted PurR-regulated permease PerM